MAEAAAQVRRSLPPLLTDHGVVACASLALRVGTRPIGVLLAASPRPIPFQDSEIYFLQEITNVVGSFLERARAEEMLKTLDTDRSRLLGRVLTSQEEERAHVSRELHDDLAQTLAGITLFAASLATSTEGQEKETSERIGEMAQDAADAVRRLIGDLRPLELEDGLAHATERLADIAGSRRGIPIQVEFEGSPQRLPDEVEVAVYRIVQEALNNIGKHAAAARAAIALRFHRRFVEIEIRDEGPGFVRGRHPLRRWGARGAPGDARARHADRRRPRVGLDTRQGHDRATPGPDRGRGRGATERMTPQNTTAMLVDDHAVVRAGIRLLLDSQTSMSVVAEASSAEEALQVSLDRDPDLIVTDLSMDGLRGAAVIEAFAERFPNARILVLSMVDSPSDVRRAIDAGARGYMLKGAAAAELPDAIARIMNGERYVQPALGAMLAGKSERPRPMPTPSPHSPIANGRCSTSLC